MNDKLRFKFETKPHPFPDHSGSRFDAWGRIEICIVRQETEFLLLDTEWNLDVLVEWLIENHDTLYNERLSIQGNTPFPSESLAQALERLQEYDFDNDEAMCSWSNDLFEFRQRHSLRFALRGTDIPDIIIGCNNGAGEISLKSEWAYQFGMEDFCRDLYQQLYKFLNTWLSTAQDVAVHIRPRNLLLDLTEAHNRSRTFCDTE